VKTSKERGFNDFFNFLISSRSTFCGTYEYMSPEVVFKKPYNANIDVWSLGILLYELITGGSPFRAKNLQDITLKFKNHKDLLFPDYVPHDLRNLISGILKMNPEQRLTIPQILTHKWMKKISLIKGNNNEHESVNGNNMMILKEKNPKILEIHKIIERKFQLPEQIRTKTSEINDFTDQRFVTSPKKSIELSITRIRKPIFFDIRKKTEINLMDSTNSIYYNKTEYNKYRNSNNTNLSNTSFLNKTNNEISVFKSIDNSKKHRIFLKETNEANPGKVLKTMENLMSQLNVVQDPFIDLKSNHKLSKNKIQFEEIKKTKIDPNKGLKSTFEGIKYREKKENLHKI